MVVSEYVEVAKAFFDGDEPKMVNGVLDVIARKLRSGELDPRQTEESTSVTTGDDSPGKDG